MSSQLQPSERKVASFISLPMELRLHIYDLVLKDAFALRVVLKDQDSRHPYVMGYIYATDCVRILRCLRVSCKTVRNDTETLLQRMQADKRQGDTYLQVLPQHYFEHDLGQLTSFSKTFDDAWSLVRTQMYGPRNTHTPVPRPAQS